MVEGSAREGSAIEHFHGGCQVSDCNRRKLLSDKRASVRSFSLQKKSGLRKSYFHLP